MDTDEWDWYAEREREKKVHKGIVSGCKKLHTITVIISIWALHFSQFTDEQNKRITMSSCYADALKMENGHRMNWYHINKL